MEQITFLLTEYPGYITMALTGFAVLLLMAALHRMRRLKKHMKQFEEKTVQLLAEMKEAVSEQGGKIAESHEQNSEERSFVQGAALDEENRTSGGMAAPENTQMAQEELLNAVLEEVFP